MSEFSANISNRQVQRREQLADKIVEREKAAAERSAKLAAMARTPGIDRISLRLEALHVEDARRRDEAVTRKELRELERAEKEEIDELVRSGLG